MSKSVDWQALGQAVSAAARDAYEQLARDCSGDVGALTDAQLRALLFDGILRAEGLPPAPLIGAPAGALADYEILLARRSQAFAQIAALEVEFGARVASARAKALAISQAVAVQIGRVGIAALLAAL